MSLFSIEHHHYFHGDDGISQSLVLILDRLNLIIQNQNKMDVTLDQTLESVTSNGTVGDSIVTLVTSLKKSLDDALAGITLPPAVQAKINAIFEASEADKAKLQEAILANTPSQPAA